jgi:hypothetical protein
MRHFSSITMIASAVVLFSWSIAFPCFFISLSGMKLDPGSLLGLTVPSA